MKKKMECKALGEVKYRSNLMVVRILTRRVTKQSAFSSPRQNDIRSPRLSRAMEPNRFIDVDGRFPVRFRRV